MKSRLLYPLLLSGVLLTASCGQSNTDDAGYSESQDNQIESTRERAPAAELPTTPIASYRVVFFGDSITAGYGVDENEAFPQLLQNLANAAAMPFEMVNAGFSGDTSTGGLSRIDWVLRNRADILVLELGGNDGLRGIDLNLTKSNLESIILRTREKYPDCKIIVAGMMVPPNLGHEYTETFTGLFPQLAEDHDAVLIPFILEGVGGVRELNLPDGIHPTAEGHEIIAQTVWKYLQPVMAEFPDPPSDS